MKLKFDEELLHAAFFMFDYQIGGLIVLLVKVFSILE